MFNRVKYSKVVIVRTLNAGVFVGEIGKVDLKTHTVVLKNFSRIWCYAGAFTLNAVASNGVDRNMSKITVRSEQTQLFDVVEIINVSDNVDLSPTVTK